MVSGKFAILLLTPLFCLLMSPAPASGRFVANMDELAAPVGSTLATRNMTKKGALIFGDEFNTFNKSVWNHMITSWRGGLNQFQYYTNRSENSWVANGMLHIKPTFTADRFNESFLYNGTLNLLKEGCNYDAGLTSSCLRKAGVDIINPIQSARISTNYSFSFTYGIVETRMKLSRGDYLWPSIWMPPRYNAYGSWPQSGEIDISEIHGNDNYTCYGKQVGNRLSKSTLHWGSGVNDDGSKLTGWTQTLSNSSFATSFHTFTMEWLKTGIYYFIDGVYIGGVDAPAGGWWKYGKFNGTNI